MQNDSRLREMIETLITTMGPTQMPGDMVETCVHVMRKLSTGTPVTLDEVNEMWPGTTVPDALPRRLAEYGMAKLDENDTITGMVISLEPTRHSFVVDGRSLFTWCALDTLFMPAVLKRHAVVTSTCPVTEQTIRLEVSPDAIESVAPQAARVSIVAPGLTPGVSASCGAEDLTGVEGSFCRRSNFFASSDAAQDWLSENPGALTLAVEDAFAVVKRIWADPFTLPGRSA